MKIWDEFWSDPENWEWWKIPAPEVLELIGAHSPREKPQVLDLGCGLGRHAIAFARAGFSVTAIDGSEAAIQHLQEWANQLGLAIKSLQGDVLDPRLTHDPFDLVLSYNVIYHGYRSQFEAAIQYVYKLLKPGGLFFFTCPSREDGKYGYGEEVAPHTYLSSKSITPGDMHYFTDEADLDALLAGFRLLSRVKDEGYFENQGQQQYYSNWQVLAQKPGYAGRAG
jgi:tellurite methyltransferase